MQRLDPNGKFLVVFDPTGHEGLSNTRLAQLIVLQMWTTVLKTLVQFTEALKEPLSPSRQA